MNRSGNLMPSQSSQSIRGSTIHVSMAVDRGFELPLTVALASLAAVHVPGQCTVSVLHSGLPAEVMKRIERDTGTGLAIDWLPVDQRDLVGAHLPDFLTKATLYRLLLPRVLADRDRTIYLDADVVVLEPLTELWTTDLGPHVVGAVRESAAPWAAGPSGTNWREIGMAPDSPYFNGGVQLLPLDVWRRDHLDDAALTVLKRTKARWGDQCAMNLVAENRWLEFPRRWNVQTADVEGRALAWALWPDSVAEAVADPAIVHFSERAKPWTPGASHPWADKWFRVLDETSWAGWRPPAREPLGQRVRRKAGRLARAS